jgi:hypothetical protein
MERQNILIPEYTSHLKQVYLKKQLTELNYG